MELVQEPLDGRISSAKFVIENKWQDKVALQHYISLSQLLEFKSQITVEIAISYDYTVQVAKQPNSRGSSNCTHDNAWSGNISDWELWSQQAKPAYGKKSSTLGLLLTLSGEIVSNKCENSTIISEYSQFYIGIRVVSVFMPFKQGHQFLNVEIMELINLVFSGIAVPFHMDRFTD